MRHVYMYHDGEPLPWSGFGRLTFLRDFHNLKFSDILWDPLNIRSCSIWVSRSMAFPFGGFRSHVGIPKIIYFRLGFSTNHPAIGVMENSEEHHGLPLGARAFPHLPPPSSWGRSRMDHPKWPTRNEDSSTHGFSMFSIAFATKNCSKKKSRSLRSAWCCRSWSINA